MNREKIPANLKRQILTEAGHRCAIPTCRFPTTELAHIIPYSKVKKHDAYNLIALCPNCHTRFDKKEIDKKSINIYKKKLIYLSDRYSRYELNVLSNLKNKGRMVLNGLISVINLLDNKLIINKKTITSFQYDDGENEIGEFIAVLTPKGKKFIEKWVNSDNLELTYEN